jgi:hypothetical protein
MDRPSRNQEGPVADRALDIIDKFGNEALARIHRWRMVAELSLQCFPISGADDGTGQR